MKLTYFEIHLVEHCNLNCKSCDNFSPLANPEYVDLKEFEKEMMRMSLLSVNQITKIRLLGGEPLLHPQVNELLKISRIYFPNTQLLLTTNGILLNKMNDEFWRVCSENNIIIEITYYPINLDRESYHRKADEFNVKIIPFDNVKTSIKITHRNPVNDKKDQDKCYNYERCYQRWRCISLKDGKIYPCTCIPNIYHFNKYFNKNIQVTEKDYINIYDVTDIKQIEEFLNHEVPFCAYCDLKNRTNGAPWSVTSYKLEEWFNER